MEKAGERIERVSLIDWICLRQSHRTVNPADPSGPLNIHDDGRWAFCPAGLAEDADHLWYATGGYAVARVEHVYDFRFDASAATTLGLSEVRHGWTAGGGVERRLQGPWSVKAEYLFVHLQPSTLDISSIPLASGAGPIGTALRFKHDLRLLRLGVNYRF